MRLLVLSRLRFLHSTRRLRAAAAARGHQALIVDPLECALVLGADGPRDVRRWSWTVRSWPPCAARLAGGSGGPTSIVARVARIEPDPVYERTARAAAQAVGLGVAGVDLLEGRNGPRVMEVNASPGFEGLERATGADVAGRIVEFAERLAFRSGEAGRARNQRELRRPRLVR